MSKNSNGQSLIEVIIGVGVAIMLAISLIMTSLVTQRTARAARNNTQATKLGQEYMEEVRVFRDRRGFDLLPNTNTCQRLIITGPDPATSWNFADCEIGSPDGDCTTVLNNVVFCRSIEVSDTIPLVKKLITVRVKWDEPSGAKEVKTETFLTKWEGLP